MFEPALTAILDAGHVARFVARGDSMHPVIRDGEAVYVERSAVPLVVGDVVLARAARGLTAHRIVRLRQRQGALEIITRGDNCMRNDAPLTTADLVGRVVSVERDSGRMPLAERPWARTRLSLRALARWIMTPGR